MIRLIFLLFFSIGFSQTYYVTTSGSSGNSGANEANSWSLVHAFATATAGDIVYVKAGNYGALELNSARAGTLANPIKFIGYTTTAGDILATNGPTYTYANWKANSDDLPDNVMPHLELNPTNNNPSANQHAFDIDHAYVEIHNFFISEYEMGVDITAANVTVNNVIGDQFGNWDANATGWDATIDSFQSTNRDGTGIRISSADNFTLTNNLMIDAGFVTYFIIGSDNGIISNCVGIAERSGNGADYVFDLYNSNDNVISNIYARRTYGTNSAGHRSRAITTQGPNGSHRNTITGLVAENLRIQAEYSDNNIYTDVTMTTINGGDGENDGSIQIGLDSNDNIFQNVSMDGGGGIQFLGYESGDGGATVTTAGSNNYFINFKIKNINSFNGHGLISLSRLGTSGVTGGTNYVVGMTADDFPWIINANRGGTINFYNSSFSNGTQSSIDTFHPSFTDATDDYTANYTNCNFNGNSFSTPSGTAITTENPQLNSSLEPASNSALIGAGVDPRTISTNADVDTAVMLDFLGNTRTIPVDIGAIEFGATSDDDDPVTAPSTSAFMFKRRN